MLVAEPGSFGPGLLLAPVAFPYSPRIRLS